MSGLTVYVIGQGQGVISVAAVATREWYGISLRDVLLFAGGVFFCLIVIRFMLTGSEEHAKAPPDPLPEPAESKPGAGAAVGETMDATRREGPARLGD